MGCFILPLMKLLLFGWFLRQMSSWFLCNFRLCVSYFSSTFKILFFHRISSLSFIASRWPDSQNTGHLYWWLLICNSIQAHLLENQSYILNLVTVFHQIPQTILIYNRTCLTSLTLILITYLVNRINHQSSWKPNSCSVLTNHYSSISKKWPSPATGVILKHLPNKPFPLCSPTHTPCSWFSAPQWWSNLPKTQISLWNYPIQNSVMTSPQSMPYSVFLRW